MISVLRFLKRESSGPIIKKKKNNAYVTWTQKGGIVLIPKGNDKVSIFLVPNQVETFT